MTADRYFSTSQTARVLGLSSRRVNQLSDAGQLACVRTPIGRLFPRDRVRDFAAGRGINVDLI